MAYTALYRKWRPRSFDDVVGQEHITTTLARQVTSGRLSHAYLFTGTRGTGKTTCAKILARAVNCENPVNGSPCNKCPTCLGIENGSILDVTEMDAASNNGVDNVRALREEAVYAPTVAKRRVYIVDEVHMLSGSAFNALLKILEEPPEHLIFILATTELRKVPATILSRCQRYAFRRIQPDAIANRLEQIAEGEGIALEPAAAAALARLADGALRDAVSLFDQCCGPDVITLDRVREVVGDASGEEIIELYSAIANGDAAGAVRYAERLYSAGQDMGSVLKQLSSLYRDLLLEKLKMGTSLASGGFDQDNISRLAAQTSKLNLVNGANFLSSTIADLERAPDRRLSAELCLVRLADAGISCASSAALEQPSVPAQDPGPESAPGMKAVPAQKGDAPASPGPSVSIPEVQSVTVPEPQPETKAGSVPNHSKSTSPAPATNSDIWRKVVTGLHKRVSPGDYTLLSDPMLVEGLFDGTQLKITAKNVFASMLLNNPALLGQIKQVAEEQCGQNVSVTVCEGNDSPAPDAADRLAKLMEDDIVTVK